MLRDPQVVAAVSARNRDDFHVGIYLVKLLDGLDPLLFRHDEVGNQDVEGASERRFQGFPAVPRLRRFVAAAFEHPAEHKPDVMIVVHDQHAHGTIAAPF